MILCNKKILVTGGAGFIPSHIVDKLVKIGASVTVIDNLHAGKIGNLKQSIADIEFLNVDVRDFDKVNNIVKKQDVVFHLAANADVPFSVENPTYDFEANAIGGFNVLRSCLDANIQKVIYASTAAVYGNAKYTPIGEGHPLDPISPYGASKLTTEKLGLSYFHTYGLPFCSIRIFNAYGERQPRYVMYDLLKKLYQNPNQLSVLGTGEQIRDYVYVTDAAKCFILAAESDEAAGVAFNLAGGNPVSIKDLVGLILESLNLKNTKVNFTGNSWKGDIIELIANTEKARNVLHFSPEVDLKTGIKLLHNWLIKQYE